MLLATARRSSGTRRELAESLAAARGVVASPGMKRLAPTLLLLLLAPSAVAHESESGGSFALLLGERWLSDDDYPDDDVDSPGVLGFEGSFVGRDESRGFELGLQLGFDQDGDDYFDERFAMSELYVGYRLAFQPTTRTRAYVGAGASLVSVSYDDFWSNDDDDDTTGGGYAHAGFGFLLGEEFMLGVDVRGLYGTDVELDGHEGDVDYVQATISLTWY